MSQDTRLLSALEKAAIACAWVALALSLAALLGWATGSTILFMPFGSVAVKPLSALCIGLCAGALLLRMGRLSLAANVAVLAMCTLTVLVAGATLAQYAFGLELGIDRMLLPSALKQYGGLFPGRMAPNSSAAFLLLALGILLLDIQTKRGVRPAQLLAMPALVIGLVTLNGFIFHAAPPPAVAMNFNTTSLLAAIGILLLSTGVLFSRPTAGFMSVLTSNTVGGILLRRLVLVTLLFPMFTTMLRLLGEHLGIFERNYGMAVNVTLSMLLFTAVVWWTATQLDRLDHKRLQQERELRESESRARDIVETAQEGIWILDPQARTSYVNQRLQEMLGYSPGEILGRSFYDFMDMTSRPDARTHFAQRVAGQVEAYDFQFKRKDGSTLWAIVSSAPLRDAAGKFTGVLKMVTDITERKRAEDEIREKGARLNELNAEMQLALQELATSHQLLQDQTASLERSNADLDDFAYIASHDLKEPLRGISNYAQFLAEDYNDKLDDEGRQMLETLPRLTKRLETLLDALLKYSRMGRAELAPAATDLDAVLEDVQEMLDTRIQDRSAEIRMPRPLPTVFCDRQQTTEVFLNLISNAIKYNDEPHRVVEVGYLAPSEIEAGGNASNGVPPQETVFYVSDNGIGIDEKYLESIFGAFRRLHGRDQYGGGAGVGLAIVKKMVERQGGRIWVESEVGRGSTFYFTLGSEPARAGVANAN